MIRLTVHQLASKLLDLPDLPVIIDGIGEEVSLACLPYTGSLDGGRADGSDEVVVLEIVTHKRYYQEQQMKDRVEGKIFSRKSIKNCREY